MSEVVEFVKVPLDDVTGLIDLEIIGDEFFASSVAGDERTGTHIDNELA